jgi:hypothetical protein
MLLTILIENCPDRFMSISFTKGTMPQRVRIFSYKRRLICRWKRSTHVGADVGSKIELKIL